MWSDPTSRVAGSPLAVRHHPRPGAHADHRPALLRSIPGRAPVKTLRGSGQLSARLPESSTGDLVRDGIAMQTNVLRKLLITGLAVSVQGEAGCQGSVYGIRLDVLSNLPS